MAAAVVAAALGVAAPPAGAQARDSAAEARVTVVNTAAASVAAVMTETPTATVLASWPRALAPGQDLEAAFSFPAMTGALSQVQYALPPDGDGDTRSCLFRWRTDASRLVRCAVVLTAPANRGWRHILRCPDHRTEPPDVLLPRPLSG